MADSKWGPDNVLYNRYRVYSGRNLKRGIICSILISVFCLPESCYKKCSPVLYVQKWDAASEKRPVLPEITNKVSESIYLLIQSPLPIWEAELWLFMELHPHPSAVTEVLESLGTHTILKNLIHMKTLFTLDNRWTEKSKTYRRKKNIQVYLHKWNLHVTQWFQLPIISMLFLLNDLSIASKSVSVSLLGLILYHVLP